jgi:hypothetical protein
MLAKQPHCARLRTFFTYLLRKAHARTDGQAIKSVEHAVAVKIDFVAVARFEEAEFAGFVQPHDDCGGLSFVRFDLSLQSADLILQLSAGPFEGVVDGERQVGMALVVLRGASYIDLTAIGQREPYVDLIEPAGSVMASGPL